MLKTKQVIVMRKDLNMRKGKMIAQGAHASMKVFLDRSLKTENGMTTDLTEEMLSWLFEDIFTKICVSVDSENELIAIYQRALATGLPAALIVDSGKTEFNGVPTPTCCAIGPDLAEKIDAITGKLSLL